MDSLSSNAPTARRAPKAWWMVCFALAVLAANWEAGLDAAALASPAIPEEAIRIRILAHSDAPRDQWVKQRVRDAIAAEVGGWELDGADAEKARAVIEAELAALERIATDTLLRYGFTYGAKAELAKVAFPAKTFEGERYPAGEYETLLITLGAGRGENWWCVLFPPLCFGGGTVKAKAAEATETAEAKDGAGEGRQKEAAADEKGHAEPDAAADGKGKTETDGEEEKAADLNVTAAKKPAPDAGTAGKAAKTKKAGTAVSESSSSGTDDVEVRFFFADLFRKAAGKVREWFA